MTVQTIYVPDLGGADAVDVIEIPIAINDSISIEDTLLVLESDKATMDVPSPLAGVVKKILVKLGDSVSQGAAIIEVSIEADDTVENAADSTAAQPITAASTEPAPKPAQMLVNNATPTSVQQAVNLPDLGTTEAVDVIEISVSVGDVVDEGDTLMTLEGDKATMDVPAPYAGEVTAIIVAEADKVHSGQQVANMLVAGVTAPVATAASEVKPAASQIAAVPEDNHEHAIASSISPVSAAQSSEQRLNEAEAPQSLVYAGPVVRQLAREMGVDLRNVGGSGIKGRIQKQDVQLYIKKALDALNQKPATTPTSGSGIPTVADVDFSQFGEIEDIPLTKIARLTAANMTKSWLNVPAVSQFDDADITDMEAFRKSIKAEAEKRGVKVTPVAFMMLAVAKVLAKHPILNRSWHSSAEKVIQKHFIHLGMAIDTPRGLVVAVIRDVDKKGLYQIATDIAELATKAREGKLRPADMQGASMTISSLGAIGGKGFTPIVNTPESVILGVSKASIQPVWNGTEFMPRQMLPLSLSYDHRLVNGVNGGRFLTDLVAALADIRTLLL